MNRKIESNEHMAYHAILAVIEDSIDTLEGLAPVQNPCLPDNASGINQAPAGIEVTIDGQRYRIELTQLDARF